MRWRAHQSLSTPAGKRVLFDAQLHLGAALVVRCISLWVSQFARIRHVDLTIHAQDGLRDFMATTPAYDTTTAKELSQYVAWHHRGRVFAETLPSTQT